MVEFSYAHIFTLIGLLAAGVPAMITVGVFVGKIITTSKETRAIAMKAHERIDGIGKPLGELLDSQHKQAVAFATMEAVVATMSKKLDTACNGWKHAGD